MTTRREQRTTTVYVQQLAHLSLLSFLVSAVLVASLHVLCPDFDPVSRFMSEYAVGEYGYLMQVALVALGVGVLALTYAFHLASDHTRWSRLVVLMLTVCGVGIVIAGVFRTDLQGEPMSISGLIHSVSVSIGFLAYVVAVWGLLLHAWRAPAWRDTTNLLLLIAPVTLLLQVIYWLVPPGYEGLVQRGFTGVVFFTLVYVAVRLRRLAASPAMAEAARADSIP